MAKAKSTPAPAPKDDAVLHGITQDDPTYQKPAFADLSERSQQTPEQRRDAVNADIAADHAGKPRP